LLVGWSGSPGGTVGKTADISHNSLSPQGLPRHGDRLFATPARRAEYNAKRCVYSTDIQVL
jgi:hypothetical protein